MQICWSDLGAAAPKATDWVALFPCSADNNQFLSYEYNSETTANGCLNFLVRDGLEDGCYEFRYLQDNSYIEVARSDGMLLSGTTSTVAVNLTIAANTVQGGTCAGLGATAQVCWEVSQSSDCATSTDWIGLYAIGAESNEFVRDAWFYTAGEPNGCRDVSIPTGVETGQYEFRYLPTNGLQSVGASAPFTYSVGSGSAEPVVELTTPVSTVAPGEEVCVSFRVTENIACTDTGDWVSLYACDAPNNNFGSWIYTQGAAEGQFCWNAPEVPGCYEFLYLMKNGYTDTVPASRYASKDRSDSVAFRARGGQVPAFGVPDGNPLAGHSTRTRCEEQACDERLLPHARRPSTFTDWRVRVPESAANSPAHR